MLGLLSTPCDVFQLDANTYSSNSGSPRYQSDTGRVAGAANSIFVKGSKESALEGPSGISYAVLMTHV